LMKFLYKMTKLKKEIKIIALILISTCRGNNKQLWQQHQKIQEKRIQSAANHCDNEITAS